MKSKLITLFLLLVTIGSITSAQGIKEEISLKYGATNEGEATGSCNAKIPG